MNDTPSPVEKETPGQPTPPRTFNTVEVSFFDTGQAIETGQVTPPEATSGQGRRIRKWVRHSPGLAAGFACALLVVIGFVIGNSSSRSNATAAVDEVESVPAAAAVPPPVPVAAPPTAIEERPAAAEPRPTLLLQRTRAPRPALKPPSRSRAAAATAPRKQSRRPTASTHSPRR